MSDVPEGPGWWQASDGRWYAPEQFGGGADGPAPPPPPAPPAPAPPAPAPPPPAPPSLAPPVAPGVLVTVGDMACTADEVITPDGRLPLARTVWVVQNNTTTSESIPTWAIVLCVLFVLVCLLGLLFLLAKERKTTGWMTVSVQGGGTYHASQIAISAPEQVADVEGRVNYIRGLVAALG
jgi:hypothetical protein